MRPVALTTIGFSSISWVGQNNSIHDTNSLGAEAKVFPDARLVNGNVESGPRNRVTVNVALTVQPVQAVLIFFEKLDMDDPTADTLPVDGEVTDRDNHGGYANDNDGDFVPPAGNLLNHTEIFTNATKSFEFQVTMQPGDNFAIAGSGDEHFLFNISNDDIVLHQFGTLAKQRVVDQFILRGITPGPNANVDPARIWQQHVSSTLTVWRFLHIEVDSMGLVENNIIPVQLASVNNNRNTNTATVQFLQPPPAWQDLARFSKGEGNLLQNLINYPIIVITPAFATVDISGRPDVVLGPAELRDDDFLQDGADVPTPTVVELIPAMREAFVEVRQDVGTSDNSVDFRLNLEDMQDHGPLFRTWWQSRDMNAPHFWVAYVLAAFQGPVSRDVDLDDEAPVWGQTAAPTLDNNVPTGREGGSAIYVETTRDAARPPLYDSSFATDLQDVIVHEVGHAVVNGGPDPFVTRYDIELLAKTPRPIQAPVRYLPIYLDLIRRSTKPAGP